LRLIATIVILLIATSANAHDICRISPRLWDTLDRFQTDTVVKASRAFAANNVPAACRHYARLATYLEWLRDTLDSCHESDLSQRVETHALDIGTIMIIRDCPETQFLPTLKPPANNETVTAEAQR
jgi:hypothetical protein